jgi:enterochelin esterase-like enzyme
MPSPTEVPSDTPVPVATVAAQQATPLPLAGRVEQGAYASQVTGREESYRVYLPPGYDGDDRRYPVLYLLHGWPYDESHWDALGVDEAADRRIVDGTLPPFMIVLPGADAEGLYITTSGGAGSFEEQLVNELMPHVDATFRSVQTREARAIGGISRGGVWALEIAFRHPDAFGIVGAHSPALSANRAPSAYDPFTLMREPGVGGLRIYLSAGDTDWAQPATVELHQALDQQGIAHQLAIHSGAHRDQLWARNLDEYLSFYAAGW